MISNSPVVFIALPTYRGDFAPLMTQSLERLIAKSHAEGLSLMTKKEDRAIVPMVRNILVAKAEAVGKFTHLLFIDNDMVFDDGALLRLLALDRDIVGALMVTRGAPYTPVVKKKNKDGEWKTYPNIETMAKEGRFASDCDGVGTGFMLIKMGVFEKLEKPYFAIPPFGETLMGEDMYFCDKAKKAGFDICVDAGLIVGHIGEYVYTMDDYLVYKEERERREKEAK